VIGITDGLVCTLSDTIDSTVLAIDEQIKIPCGHDILNYQSQYFLTKVLLMLRLLTSGTTKVLVCTLSNATDD